MRVKAEVGGAAVLQVLLFLSLALASALCVPCAWAQAQAETESQVRPPLLLGRPDVPYPEQATGDARVVLELLVEADGSVSEVKLAQGEEPFASVAKAAAERWVFVPAISHGHPRRARIRLEVRFVAPQARAPESSDEHSSNAGSSSIAEEPAPVVDVVIVGARPEPSRALGRTDVRQLPGAFGDPFRAIESLPGVTPIASGVPYFFVRGAPPGNVGYFFDGVRVPGLFHIAAGPGVIHPALIDEVRLYSGPYPARHGRYMGGIVTANARPPEYRFRGEASLRLVDSGAMLELPFAQGKGSVMLAGRYSYTAAVVSLIADDLEISYWDYQARAVYDLTQDDQISVLGFGNSDFIAQDNQTNFDSGFHRVELRYDRQFSDATHGRFALGGGVDQTFVEEFDALNDGLTARVDVEHQFDEELLLRSGVDARYDGYSVEQLDTEEPPDGEDAFELQGRAPSRDDYAAGTYVDLVWQASPRVELMPGLRLDFYDTGGVQALSVEPRLMARYQITPELAVNHGVGIAQQPPALPIPVPGLGLTLDDDGLQTALHSSAGLELSLPADFRLDLTAYNLVFLDLLDGIGVSRLDNGDPTINTLSRSLGSSRGLEIYLRRPLSRRLGGYLSYTLAWSRRSLGRSSGPALFDRRHVFNTAAAYDLGAGYRFGLRASVYTGVPADVAFPWLTESPPRTPAYYRFDWRFEKRWQLDERAWMSLVLEVLNTTLNKEVLNMSCNFYRCRQEKLGPVTIPSIGLEAGF